MKSLLCSLFLFVGSAQAMVVPVPNVPPPLRESDTSIKYVLDDDTEVFLDGHPVEFDKVPNNVEVIELKTWGRHIDRIGYRTTPNKSTEK